MADFDANWAFAQYESVRSSLPTAIFPTFSEPISCFAELVDRFDVFLLDAFGVLNVGDTAIPSALKQVAQLQVAGKHVMVLTNGATHPTAVAQAKYHKFGFDFDINDVVSSRDVLAEWITKHSLGLLGVMGGPGISLEELPCNTILLGENRGDYDRVSGFLALSSIGWQTEQQALLLASLKERPRSLLVGNPDIVAPRETGLTLEPGYFAHQVATETGIVPQFFGKPFSAVYDLAFSRLDEPNNERVLMVGDTLHTDVLGGAAYGIKTALVTEYGLFAGLNVRRYIKESGITPDFITGLK
jgi:glycerol 3-phosphatase-2